MIHRAHLALALSLSLASIASPRVASAQPAASQADRDQARELALQGINAFNRSDFATVIQRFESAERVFHAPVHLRFLALAYERSAPPRLLDARDAWRRLSQEQLPADAPQPFRDAVAEAARELPRVEALLGRLQLRVSGGGDGMVVEVDGRGVHPNELTQPQFVAPGQHLITARRAGFVDVQSTVSVAAGESTPVDVRFVPIPATPVETPHPIEAPTTQTVTRANPLRTVGIAVAAVGGAALIGGVITGVMASSAFSDLEAACPNGVCANASDLDRRSQVDTLAGATTGLLVSGGVLAAAGIVMIIVGRPRQETVQVSAGLRGGGLAIHF